MKTTTVIPFNFSSYPTLPIEAPKVNTVPVRRGESVVAKNTVNGTPGKSTIGADVPENWDESWFANYE